MVRTQAAMDTDVPRADFVTLQRVTLDGWVLDPVSIPI